MEEVEALALKRALALDLQRLLRQNSMTRSEMAEQMKTSRAAVDRLLDASNPAVSLGEPCARGTRMNFFASLPMTEFSGSGNAIAFQRQGRAKRQPFSEFKLNVAKMAADFGQYPLLVGLVFGDKGDAEAQVGSSVVPRNGRDQFFSDEPL